MLDNSNNNSYGSIVSALGGFASDIKVAYQNHLQERANEQRIVDEICYRRLQKIAYMYVSIEMSEVFNVASTVIDSVEEQIHPIHLLLSFDNVDFLYQFCKAQTRDERETPHIRVIEATLNKICLERYRRGLSPFCNPLECKVTEQKGKYIVSVDLLENEIQQMIPFRLNTYGYYIGLLHYDKACNRLYIGGKIHLIIYVGSTFQLLNRGIFETTCIDNKGYIQLSTGTIHASKALLRGVRMASREM